jgi:hypothetical protein
VHHPEQRGAKQRTCEHCGADVLRQLVGHRAALKVTADAIPLPAAEAHALREPNRLVWCVAQLRGGGVELRWQCRTACGHGLVIEHRCPAEARAYGRRPEGAMW